MTKYLSKDTWATERSRILQNLERTGGFHLIIVKYCNTHYPNHHWVYNRADIDNAKVVWAMDMGLEKNKELLDYFNDRKVWLLEICNSKVQLIQYD